MLAEWVVRHLPQTSGYCEPFGGMLSVFLNKPLSRLNIINDMDERIVSIYRALRDEPEELMRVLVLTPHSRSEYVRCLDDSPDLPVVERARRTLVVLAQSIRHSTNSKASFWRRGINPTRGIPVKPDEYWPARLFPILDKFKEAQIENKCALELIEDLSDFDDYLIYCDPPYHPETRSKSGQEAYGFEMDAGA